MEQCQAKGIVFENHFRHLCGEYFYRQSQIASTKLRKAAVAEAVEGLIQLNENDNFSARVAHICVEEGTRELMNTIFEVDTSRSAVDDKATRVSELWDKIATDFFSARNWELEMFDQNRTGPAGVQFINPLLFCEDEEKTFDGAAVRSCFQKLKTLYTYVYEMWHGSGRNDQGGLEFEEGIEGDDIFYERFALTNYPNHARVLFYCHLIWNKSPPAFCLRTQTSQNQSQVGVEGTNLKPLIHTNKKQKLGLHEFANAIIKGFNPEKTAEQKQLTREAEQAALQRDQAIVEYYRAKATEQTNVNVSNSKKFSVDQWQGVAHILSAAGVPQTNVDQYVVRLESEGYNTALSMIFVDDETLAKAGIPKGQPTAILKFMQTTQW